VSCGRAQDDPIRQGKQRYQHLVIQLDRLDERELELAIPEVCVVLCACMVGWDSAAIGGGPC